MYYITLEVIVWVQALLLIVASIYGIANLKNLFVTRHKKMIMVIKRHTFVFLTPAIASLAIALVIRNTMGLLGIARFPSVADIFFVVSYLLFIAGFGYFWFRSAKLHKLHIKEPFFILGVVCGVFIWLYYLFVISIIPLSEGRPFLSDLLDFFYPVAVSMIFVFTLVIHPRLKAKVIRTPLWYISHGIFTYFLGFMFMTYDLWNATMEFFPALYTVLFLLSSGYFALGFFAAKKKYR